MTKERGLKSFSVSGVSLLLKRLHLDVFIEPFRKGKVVTLVVYMYM